MKHQNGITAVLWSKLFLIGNISFSEDR